MTGPTPPPPPGWRPPWQPPDQPSWQQPPGQQSWQQPSVQQTWQQSGTMPGQLPDPPKKPWYTSWWIIAIAALAVLLIVGNAARGVGGDSQAVAPGVTLTPTTSRATTPSATPRSTSAATTSSAPTSGGPTSTGPTTGSASPTAGVGGTATVGDTVSFSTEEGAGTVTLNSVRRLTTGEIFGGTPTNGTYLVVDVTLVVTGGTASANPFLWQVQGPDGSTYDIDLFAVESLIDGGQIAAGSQVRGDVAFDAPAGPLTVALSSFFGGPIATFTVTE